MHLNDFESGYIGKIDFGIKKISECKSLYIPDGLLGQLSSIFLSQFSHLKKIDTQLIRLKLKIVKHRNFLAT
jgi:hypothetical protein